MADPTIQSVRRAIKKSVETVFCRAKLSTTQSDLTGNSWNKINLNSVDVDSGENFDTTAYRFDVPVTGLYEIIGSIEFTSVIADKRYMTAIYKNGVSIRSVSAHASLVANLTVGCVDGFFLQSGDYIELYGQPEVGVGTDTVDVVSGTAATILVVRLITKEGVRQ